MSETNYGVKNTIQKEGLSSPVECIICGERLDIVTNNKHTCRNVLRESSTVIKISRIHSNENAKEFGLK